MSSFIKELTNPKTGKKQKAYCIDNYYGNHIYGYGFRKDGKDADLKDYIDFNECDFYRKKDLLK